MSVGAGPGLSLYSISCWVGHAPTSQLVLIPLIHRVTSLRYVTPPGFHTTSNTNIYNVLFIAQTRLIIVLLLLSFFTIKLFKQFSLKIIYIFFRYWANTHTSNQTARSTPHNRLDRFVFLELIIMYTVIM